MCSAKLLIGTRFGLGIRDPEWFEHRLEVISAITVPSLLAQDDQNFHWALFIDPDLPSNTLRALEERLALFKGRAFLCTERHHESATVMALAQDRGLVDDDGYVLTGRIDDDDAWHRKTVRAVRERAENWRRNRGGTPGLAFTFETGLVWIMYEMLDIERLQEKGDRLIHNAGLRTYSVPFPSMSGFIFCHHRDGIGAISISHARIPKIVASKGYEIEYVSTDNPMWLYCRHKQSISSSQRSEKADEVEVSLAKLARDFGIDEGRAKSYIANAHEHGYGIEKRLIGRRFLLTTALKEAHGRLNDPSATDSQKARLKREEQQLKAAITKISERVVGDAGEFTDP
jgi:Putative rhamnosyl transferase